MGLREHYRQLPPNPFRRGRRDVLIGVAGAVISGMGAVAGATKRVTPAGDLNRSIALTVADRRVVAHDQDVVARTLVGKDLPHWHPGAHIDIHLPSGLVRQYSLCGDPARRDAYRIAARRFRFIAGGIGITPILPMLRLAQRLGVDWSMVYVGRSRDSLPFVDEMGRFGSRVAIRTDDVSGLPTAAELLGDRADGSAVYACGPAPMLTAIRSALVGRDDVELHFERFAAPPVIDGKEFSVSVASTGETVRVGAEETLLSALNRAGVHAPYSCRQGFCGTCRTRVLGVVEGTIDHRDTLLTDPERDNGMMLICISRAAGGSHLTLDL
ncbi:MAG TPA: PDR/VanB family oxidoreductase [Mycobacterium sp.]|nr:PDR/VanB family oxidoreductase [Mycobacterium sp.]